MSHILKNKNLINKQKEKYFEILKPLIIEELSVRQANFNIQELEDSIKREIDDRIENLSNILQKSVNNKAREFEKQKFFNRIVENFVKYYQYPDFENEMKKLKQMYRNKSLSELFGIYDKPRREQRLQENRKGASKLAEFREKIERLKSKYPGKTYSEILEMYRELTNENQQSEEQEESSSEEQHIQPIQPSLYKDMDREKLEKDIFDSKMRVLIQNEIFKMKNSIMDKIRDIYGPRIAHSILVSGGYAGYELNTMIENEIQRLYDNIEIEKNNIQNKILSIYNEKILSDDEYQSSSDEYQAERFGGLTSTEEENEEPSYIDRLSIKEMRELAKEKGIHIPIAVKTKDQVKEYLKKGIEGYMSGSSEENEVKTRQELTNSKTSSQRYSGLDSYKKAIETLAKGYTSGSSAEKQAKARRELTKLKTSSPKRYSELISQFL